MSPRLPTLTPRKMIQVIERVGFTFHYQKGSHAYFRHEDGRWTTVAIHSRDLPRGTVRKILRDIGLTEEEFSRHL